MSHRTPPPAVRRRLRSTFPIPHLRTNRTFMRNRGTAGKFYCTQVARFPGDPRAVISSKDDLARICREEGWGCEEVGVKRPRYLEPEPQDRYEVADDIVHDEIANIEEREGPLPEKEKTDLFHDLKQKMSGDV